MGPFQIDRQLNPVSIRLWFPPEYRVSSTLHFFFFFLSKPENGPDDDKPKVENTDGPSSLLIVESEEVYGS